MYIATTETTDDAVAFDSLLFGRHVELPRSVAELSAGMPDIGEISSTENTAFKLPAVSQTD